jgi:hypothetical protein
MAVQTRAPLQIEDQVTERLGEEGRRERDEEEGHLSGRHAHPHKVQISGQATP